MVVGGAQIQAAERSRIWVSGRGWGGGAGKENPVSRRHSRAEKRGRGPGPSRPGIGTHARARARTDRTAPHRTAAHAHTGGQARPPPRTRWEAWKVPAGSRSIRSQRGSSRVGGVAIGGCWRFPAGETPRRISAQSRGPCPGTGGWGGAGKGRGRVPGGDRWGPRAAESRAFRWGRGAAALRRGRGLAPCGGVARRGGVAARLRSCQRL